MAAWWRGGTNPAHTYNNRITDVCPVNAARCNGVASPDLVLLHNAKECTRLCCSPRHNSLGRDSVEAFAQALPLSRVAQQNRHCA
eukprot:6898424-Pyramimonas_sp.AAC.1